MPLDSLGRWIGYTNVVLQALVVWKLGHENLAKAFRWFRYWLIFEVARSVVSLPLSFRSNAYAYFFFAGLPVAWLLYILVTAEVYERSLNSYRGLALVGRRTVVGVVAFCLAAGVILVVPDLVKSGDRYPILVVVLSANRWVVNSVALLLLAQVAFQLWFPGPIKRNTIVHSLILTLYFLTESGADLLRDQMGAGVWQWTNLLLVVLGAVWTVGWLVLLRQSGEKELFAWRSAPPPEFESRVLKQLNSLNSFLDRSVKK